MTYSKRFSAPLAIVVVCLLPSVFAQPARASDKPFIIVASTTSTQNSGLFGYILPKIEKDLGIDIRVVAVGTGAALDMGKRCDADALLVHAKQAELKYVAAGFGIDRHDLMYNDFVIVGPSSDPAHIGGMNNPAAAFKKIYHDKAIFLSRGDDSGTNIRELALWKTAGLTPMSARDAWYKETGSGMGATLNTAREMDAYTLTDRATWISFKNKGDLKILVQGSPQLYNQYGVMLVNPARCPETKVALARKFMDWLLSAHGQHAIASYRLDGRQLFHPDAKQ